LLSFSLLALYYTPDYHTTVASVTMGLITMAHNQYATFGFGPHVFPTPVQKAL
jgi:hypothetical protein